MSHHCHASGCSTPTKPEMFMCKKHWYMLTAEHRAKIWATYRAGQCDDWKPSESYCHAARDAVVYLATKEGITPDTKIYDTFLKYPVVMAEIKKVITQQKFECLACEDTGKNTRGESCFVCIKRERIKDPDGPTRGTRNPSSRSTTSPKKTRGVKKSWLF